MPGDSRHDHICITIVAMQHLGAGDRIAIAAFIGGLAGTLAAMALPLAYPDLPTWAGRLIFWPSFALMVLAMAFLIYDLIIRPRILVAGQRNEIRVLAVPFIPRGKRLITLGTSLVICAVIASPPRASQDASIR